MDGGGALKRSSLLFTDTGAGTETGAEAGAGAGAEAGTGTGTGAEAAGLEVTSVCEFFSGEGCGYCS